MTNRFLYCLVFLLLCSTLPAADSYEIGGGFYRAMRDVDVPSGAKPAVLVTQFLHQGLINLSSKGTDPREENAGKTVLVTTKTKKIVPFKILQLGPGDFCRIAIQVDEKFSSYVIYYGVPAEKQPNKGVQLLPWTTDAGLLMETRWVERAFSMDNVDQLKKAFEQAKPVGADYVRNVMHGFNPMSFRREPFLSRYIGNLYITTPGAYDIMTSSHQGSFLLIDGRVVADQAGRRGRAHQANPELVKRINLSQGKHSFEYYHATGDDQASMMAVWEFSPGEKMKKPTLIPPEAFESDKVAKVPAGGLTLADSPGAPDFEYRILNSVPLPDNETQMIAVQFTNKTSTGVAARGKPSWNFGDGQTGDEANPVHIYMKPGIYNAELVTESGDHRFSVVNRVEIDQPHTLTTEKDKQPSLDVYLPVLEKYDATKLDPEALLQLVEAYQAKIDLLLNPLPEEDQPKTADKDAKEKGAKGEKGEKSEKPAPPRRRSVGDPEQVTKYRRLIAETVRAALVENPNFKGDQTIHQLALIAGDIARDFLLDWKLAGQIYVAAAQKLTAGDLSAECSALAADVALEMMNKTAAKSLLDTAAKKVPKMGIGTPISTYHRVRAEFLAESGNGEEARKELTEAARTTSSGMHFAEKIALQGSASRSAEKFLQENNSDRAIVELRTWQREYPAAVFDGYLTLLFAKYWVAREKYPQAAALADRQMTLNPDSPYIDELLLVASEAQNKAGKKDAAKSYLTSLIKSYPGSPLIPQAKEQLKALE